MGRRYSTVEDAMGGVGSDMRFLARNCYRGLLLDATTTGRNLFGEAKIQKLFPQSIDCNSLPGLNRTALPGGIETSAPVRGLRPMPVLRGRTLNTPNPRNSMRCPWASDLFMLSKTVSTANSALVLVIPVLATTSLIMSSLITNGSRGRRQDDPSSD